jgi:Xaa-Pro dipeptidase
MRVTPVTELEFRCQRLQERMAGVGLDAVIIVQNADLYYFTGTTQTGNLYVPAHGQPLYMVRRDALRARMESGLREVVPFGSMKDIPRILAEYGYPVPTRIGLELDVLPVAFFDRYRSVFPEAAFSDATPLIRLVRMIKSAYEIHLLKDAADQVHKVYQRVSEVAREGVTDLELTAELEHVSRREGHQGLVRMRAFNGGLVFGLTCSGADSAVPAYTDTPLGGLGVGPSFGLGASFKPIERHEPIVVDISGCCDGYFVDQTRIFSIGGLSTKLRKAYDDMVKIQERMKELVPARPSWGEVYDECLAMAVSMGHGESFMGLKGSQVSFIGHGVGIEIDEYPFIARGIGDQHFAPGMVFAFEPKVVFPGEGAVGIEDTFYLADDGLLRQLTRSPAELVVL